MADYSREIDQLRQVINGATTSVTVDGITTRFSIEQARKRLSELLNLDDASIANENVRPPVMRIKLGGAW